MARIKLSSKQAFELIRQLGVDAELVGDDQEDPNFRYEDAISDVDGSRTRIIRPDLEAELREQLTSQIAGKFGGDLRAQLRRVSGGTLKTSDLKDLKDEEAIQKFLDVMIGQKDQSIEDIRTQLKTQLQEWENEKVRIISEKDTEYKALKSSYLEQDKDAIVERLLTEIPRVGGNIKAQTQLAKQYVRSKYYDHYDETSKKIELRDAHNQEKLALVGNVAVSLKDVLTEFAKEAGILKVDMRNEDPLKYITNNSTKLPAESSILQPGRVSNDLQALEAKIMG